MNFWVERCTDVAIVSTDLWEQLRPDAGLAPYLFHTFGTLILAHRGDLNLHDATRCPFEYDDDPTNVDRAIRNGRSWLIQPASNSKLAFPPGSDGLEQLERRLRLELQAGEE